MLKRFGFNSVAYKPIYIFSLLLIFSVNATPIAKESSNDYFPHTSGSFWVYEDQDGNKLTRRAVAEKTIEDETYHAFSYEPSLEDWTDYEHYLRLYFYQIRKDGIAFFVGDEVEKAFKAKLRKEMDADSEGQQGISTSPGASADFSYAIEIDAQDDFYLLPTPVVFDKEWTAMQISGAITLKLKIQSPDFQIPGGDRVNAIPIDLVEKGKVVGTETVKTPAGTFKDCLKIEYLMGGDSDAKATEEKEAAEPESSDASDIDLTTLWLAPNVGIVKFIRTSTTSKVEKSLELTQYEIVSTESEGK